MAKGEGGNGLNAAEAAKKIKAHVTVPTRDKKGDLETVTLADGRRVFKTETVPAAESHIHAINDHGDRYHVITVDGQKHELMK